MSDTSYLGGAGLPDVNQGWRILLATGITTFVALILVLARFYVRIFIIRNVGWDDYTMALTMLLSLCGFAIIVPEVKYGAGRHTVYVEHTASKAMHLNFATQGIYLWAIGLVKVSIGLFLLRFAPQKGYKIFIWVVIVLMTLYTAICFLVSHPSHSLTDEVFGPPLRRVPQPRIHPVVALVLPSSISRRSEALPLAVYDSSQTLVFECKDIRTNWDKNVVSECFSSRQLLILSYTNTALNILTDLIFALLPIFMLRHLQVNRRVKASLVCILGLGIFACAAAFVKISILPNYGRNGDFLWDYTNLTIWVVTECNTGIMAGSLPTLKPLFKRVLGTYGSRSKTTREYYGSKQYKLRSMSRSRGEQLHSHGHLTGNLSVIERDDDIKLPRSNNPSGNTSLTREGSNSSKERILGDGIVCTTEVMVSHSQHSQHSQKNSPTLPPAPSPTRLGRMKSLKGFRVEAEDRV